MQGMGAVGARAQRAQRLEVFHRGRFDDLEPIRALERFLIGACRPVTTNTPREAVSPSPAAPEATRGSGVH
jgi:hypothetical protein